MNIFESLKSSPTKINMFSVFAEQIKVKQYTVKVELLNLTSPKISILMPFVDTNS